jgi:hypothetical protein
MIDCEFPGGNIVVDAIEDPTRSARKVFYIGIKPDSDVKPLENEEARYVINDDSVYIYGEILSWLSK